MQLDSNLNSKHHALFTCQYINAHVNFNPNNRSTNGVLIKGTSVVMAWVDGNQTLLTRSGERP